MTDSAKKRPPDRADVCVAGGGPAGATVATLLAKLGYRVTLLEALHFPRPHIGESLTPAVHRIFEFLEIRELIDSSGFVRMPGHTVHWGGKHDTFYFSDEYDRPAQGYQVWRERFDALLIERAAGAGVSVHHGYRVTGTLRTPGGSGGRVCGVEYIGHGSAGRVEAQLVIDATGQSGRLARAHGLRAIDAPARSLSLWAYWREAGDLAGADATNTFVESTPDGWIWSVRSRPEFRGVTVNVDFDEARRELRTMGLLPYYMERLRQGPATSAMLAGATRASHVRGRDTTWYHAPRTYDDGLIVIGDAACLIDPLTSQGVRKALTSAINGAVVANTMLVDSSMEEIAAAFHREREETAYQRYRREAVRAFLDENRFATRPYWRKRSRQRFGDPGAEPPPPRRGLLRQKARDERLQDQVLRWADGARLEEGAVVEGPILARRLLFKSPERPEGRLYPDFQPGLLFDLINGERAVPEVVDHYLERSGRGRDDRAQIMTILERLVEDWLCDVETRPPRR